MSLASSSKSRPDSSAGRRSLDRRRFLVRTGCGALLLGARAGGAGLLLAADAAPSRKLATAVIGCGGRGAASLEAALGERLVAIVDIEDQRLAAAMRTAEKHGATPRTFSDYRKMFDAMAGEIDVVFVATPDHHHAPAALRALQSGKHVFCEKPLCHDIAQARLLAAAARAAGTVTMMGNQGHCGEGYRRVCEYLAAGAIGEVVETHSWTGFVNGGAATSLPTRPIPEGLHWDEWLGPAPERSYQERLHPLYWRYVWDFGTGSLGDWGCHNLDGVYWALQPTEVTHIECVGTIGGTEEMYPQASVLRWDVAARAGRPAFKSYWYDGGKLGKDYDPAKLRGRIRHPNYPPMLAELEAQCGRDFKEGWDGGTFYIGTKGILHSGCYGERPRLLPDTAHQAFPAPAATLPRVNGSHFDHFLASCRANQPTRADFAYAAGITEFLLLGHLAIKAGVGVSIPWDAAGMRVPGHPELDPWIKRSSRPGWGV